MSSAKSIQGVGLGLRFPLLDALLECDAPELRWLECHPENYMRRGGRFPEGLRKCREKWPFATHGLTMSLGGVDRFDDVYVKTLGRFLREIETPWHSDHLCFSVAHGVATHDLLPPPMNEDTVKHFVARIREAQDRLPVPLAVENVSYYVTPKGSDLDEGTFVDAIVRESACKLMLDVNNVFVNAANFGHDPRSILARMPLDRVVQIHVAGHFYEEPDCLYRDPESHRVRALELTPVAASILEEIEREDRPLVAALRSAARREDVVIDGDFVRSFAEVAADWLERGLWLGSRLES